MWRKKEKKLEADCYTLSVDRRFFYEPTSKDGYTQGSFATFGKYDEPNPQNQLSILFTLNEMVNGSAIYPTPPNPPFRFEVSNQIKKDDNKLLLTLEIECGQIVLPDLDAECGCEPDVDDWDNEEIIDIPIN